MSKPVGETLRALVLKMGDIFTDDDNDVRLITDVSVSETRLLTFTTLCFLLEHQPVRLVLSVTDIQFRKLWQMERGNTNTYTPLCVKESHDP